MKSKLLFVSAFLFSLFAFAQVPQGISYQAIALNGSGGAVVSSNVGIRISVLNNSATGTVLYTETHVKTTNAQGLFNLVIGQGTVVAGTFAAIDWRVNSKFLKVEMDTAGGTNYVLVGSTQLLSAPYALAADSLVTSAGEGITLVSPNGTPYQLTVNDSGQLSLPTSGASGTIPNSFYVYGSFNGFDAPSAIQMQTGGGCGSSTLALYKYFTAGTQLKLLSANNASSPVYGIDASQHVVANGNAVNIPTNGFYLVNVYSYQAPTSLSSYSFAAGSLDLGISLSGSAGGNAGAPTYNTANNKFTFIFTGMVSGQAFHFTMQSCVAGSGLTNFYGDNLADGTIENNGAAITLPGLTSTPKNYKVELTVNATGGGTYTAVQIP